MYTGCRRQLLSFLLLSRALEGCLFSRGVTAPHAICRLPFAQGRRFLLDSLTVEDTPDPHNTGDEKSVGPIVLWVCPYERFSSV
jgi:hypothetical protein